MKGNIFIILCALFFLSSSHNRIAGAESEVMKKKENLELKGLLADENLIRSPVREVYMEGTAGEIDISFFIRCHVNIRVINTDNGALMYEGDIPDTRQENRIRISTGAWQGGGYQIILKNQDNGRTAYACFRIE